MPNPRKPRPPRAGRVLPLRRAVAAQAPGEAGEESARRRIGDGRRDGAAPGLRRWTMLAFAVAALAVPGFTVAMTMVSESGSQPGPSVTWSRGGAPLGVSQESSADPAERPKCLPHSGTRGRPPTRAARRSCLTSCQRRHVGAPPLSARRVGVRGSGPRWRRARSRCGSRCGGRGRAASGSAGRCGASVAPANPTTNGVPESLNHRGR